jgi:2-polyprenyl-3-methyl-5-hydroxy-6-metoxy-1,4-benzoquinol methylase
LNYDAEKIADFFSNGEKWRDAQDEITLMHMNTRTQTVLMGIIIDEIRKVMNRKFGAVRLIDVGCGTGMLLDYLDEAKLLHRVISYIGYDIVEKFLALAVERAKKYRTLITLRNADFFAEEDGDKADIVIATQCLNTVFTDDQYGFIALAIRKLWERATDTVIFDVKDVEAPYIHPNRLYYDPERVYSLCRGITQNVTIKQATKANFTVVLSKEELF